MRRKVNVEVKVNGTMTDEQGRWDIEALALRWWANGAAEVEVQIPHMGPVTLFGVDEGDRLAAWITETYLRHRWQSRGWSRSSPPGLTGWIRHWQSGIGLRRLYVGQVGLGAVELQVKSDEYPYGSTLALHVNDWELFGAHVADAVEAETA